MRPRHLSRRSAGRVRATLRRIRRRVQPFRIPIAAVAGGLGAIFGTVYEDTPPGLRVAAIAAVGVLTTVAVLLTDAPTKLPAEPTPFAAPTLTARRRRWWGWWRGGRERVGRNRRWWWPRRPAPRIAADDALFRGRSRELAALLASHDAQRAARGGGRWPELDRNGDRQRTATGPVLLLVHGPPGVGKSALVKELARRLADRYPHGQFFASLSTVGGSRTPGEILKIFLLALGWPKTEIPTETVERAKIFRSLTARRRMLFVLDGARHAELVRAVLPSDPGLAVIVTSRRDFGPDLNTPSAAVGIPEPDEALEILRAVTRTDDSVRPECAAEIVELCGRLPLAIRTIGERVFHDGADLCHVADLLRTSASRLSWLERRGRSVVERFITQYERLLPQEQRALRLLTLVASPTFVPWVLRPLLDVPLAEAENLVVRLGAAQMLENAGRDEASGLARYAFHPLVRLFAAGELADTETAAERRAAQERLDAAYREVVTLVLAELDDAVRAPAAQHWLPTGSALHRHIAERPEPWVRAEYRNVVRFLMACAQGSDDELCWRIATWLGGCVPDDGDTRATLTAYDRATRAARRVDDPLALVDVLLAKGSFLVAIEWYERAEETFTRAVQQAQQVRETGSRPAGEALRREAVAHRRRGEAYLQMAIYHEADRALNQALTLAQHAGDGQEVRLIRMLIAETHQVDSPDPSYLDVLDGRLNDTTCFRAYLAFAEASRRRGDWASASGHLARALKLNSGDARRVATVQYRTARLLLNACHVADEQARLQERAGLPVEPTDRRALAYRAVRRAAEATLTFRRMHNAVGLVRAHSLLARALLAAGHLIEAEHVARAAERELAGLGSTNDPARELALAPLLARVRRTNGELLLHRGDLAGGRRLLVEAATLFGAQHDWAAEAQTLRLIRAADQHAAATGHPPSIVDGRAAVGPPTGQTERPDPTAVHAGVTATRPPRQVTRAPEARSGRLGSRPGSGSG